MNEYMQKNLKFEQLIFVFKIARNICKEPCDLEKARKWVELPNVEYMLKVKGLNDYEIEQYIENNFAELSELKFSWDYKENTSTYDIINID